MFCFQQYQILYTFKSRIPEEKIVSEQEIKVGFSPKAFKSWEGASQFTFQEVSDGSSANIVIGFYKGNHGDGEPFDGPGMVLAHSFFPEDGRSHYDGDESWSTNPDYTQMDLQSVAVHELGHVLGLGHCQDPEAIICIQRFRLETLKESLQKMILMEFKLSTLIDRKPVFLPRTS